MQLSSLFLSEPICSHNEKQIMIWYDATMMGDDLYSSKGELNFEECKKSCLENTKCVGFTFFIDECDTFSGNMNSFVNGPFPPGPFPTAGIKCGHNVSPTEGEEPLRIADEFYPEFMG